MIANFVRNFEFQRDAIYVFALFLIVNVSISVTLRIMRLFFSLIRPMIMLLAAFVVRQTFNMAATLLANTNTDFFVSFFFFWQYLQILIFMCDTRTRIPYIFYEFFYVAENLCKNVFIMFQDLVRSLFYLIKSIVR